MTKTIADHYFGLLNRIAELQGDIKEITKAVADGTRLNAVANAPSDAHLQRLKDALANHVKHVQELQSAVEQIERDADPR